MQSSTVLRVVEQSCEGGKVCAHLVGERVTGITRATTAQESCNVSGARGKSKREATGSDRECAWVGESRVRVKTASSRRINGQTHKLRTVRRSEVT